MAPIEMSISPAIMSKPTGIATMPRLAARFTQLAAPRRLARLTPNKTKKAMTAIRLRMAPASGRRRKLPMRFMSLSSLLLRDIAERHGPEGVVGQNRDEQQRTDNDRTHIGIDAREEDALVHDREGQGAENDADDGAETAR